MKKRFIYGLSCILAISMGAGMIVSCGDEGGTTPTVTPTLSINEEAQSIKIGGTFQFHVTLKDAKSDVVDWTSSSATVATISSNGLVTGIAVGETTITATLHENSAVKDTVKITVTADPTIAIKEEDATIEVAQTTKFTTKIEYATSDVVDWSSSNETIATVDNNGLVTALAIGETTITAALHENATIKDTVKVVVTAKSPTSITIGGYESTNVTSPTTLNLTSTVAPSDAINTVTWSSSDESIATVTADGQVSFIAKGEVKITATSSVKESIKGEVTFNSSYIVSDYWGAETWNFDGLKGANPTFSNKLSVGYCQNAVINDYKGQQYVFETTVNIANRIGENVWARVGIGHIDPNASSTFHGYMFSPFSNKTVFMNVGEGGSVDWGAVTDRSQIWGQHGLNDVDITNIKLTAVRDNSKYYYFINDALFYVESNYEKFNDIDTIPAFQACDLNLEFSNISIMKGESKVNEFKNAHSTEISKTLYATDSRFVSIEDNEKTIKFTGVGTAPTNVKDVAAKSIGDAFYLPGGVESKIEFDLNVKQFGSTDGTPACVVTMTRFEAAPLEARSWVIGENKAGFTGWQYTGNLNDGIGNGGTSYGSPITENKIYHVICTKLVGGSGGCDTKISVNGVDYAHGWDDGYKDGHVVQFGVRDMDAELTNVTLTVSK